MADLYFPVPNISSPDQLLTYANSVTNNLYGIGVLIASFLILFIAFKDYETEKALSASAWITTGISVPMVIVGLLAPEITVICIVLTTISTVFLMFR